MTRTAGQEKHTGGLREMADPLEGIHDELIVWVRWESQAQIGTWVEYTVEKEDVKRDGGG